jgi:Tfp pilus assembly protein PilO
MKSLTPIILILVSVGVFFFFIDPKYQEVKALQIQIEDNNVTLEKSKQLTAIHKTLRDKFNNISRAQRDELEKLLPDNVDNVRLLIDIDRIAKELGIIIRDIEISTEQNPAPASGGNFVATDPNIEPVIFENEDTILNYVDTNKIGVVSFSFSTTSQYADFLEFLDQLEKSKRIVDIRSIEISRSGTNAIFFEYKVNFDTYWLK